MQISRRTVLGAGVAGGLAAGLGAVSTATASTTTTTTTQASEQEQLQALYRQAKAEGGKVIVYMGGDAPGQWDFIGQAFTAQYPGIEADLIVDLSKYHDADMAILQTAQDFDRWKDAGELLRYKPVGWDAVFSNAKDSDGYWTGVFYAAFSPIISSSLAPADPTTFRATDLLKPEFKDK